MAESQENSSKLLSVSSSENRDSTGFSNPEADGRDEEFYERIEAPKFVDFTVPDHYCPDDRYWFCLRVGCDQKHEEEMDSEAIYKNFVLRVMAARSPNIKLRKALERRNASRTPIKCPLSAPPKSSKPRLSRMAIISSISEKMADEKKRVVRPILKPRSTPVTKTKPVAAKYLTTPRNNKCTQNQSSFRSVQNPKPSTIEVPKSRILAKALVFHSPKKAIKVKTSVELRTPISKLCEGMKKLEISSQRKRVLGYSSKSVKDLSNNSSRRQLRSSKVKRKPEQLPSSQTCNNEEAKSARLIKSKIKEKSSQNNASKKLLETADSSKNNESRDMAEKVAEEIELQESTHEEASMSSMVPPLARESDVAAPDDTKGEGNCLDLEGGESSRSQSTNREENNSNVGHENGGESRDHLNANNFSEGEINGHEFMDGDDKENAAASDENRMHNKNPKQNGRIIFGMSDKSGQIKKVAQTQDKILKESLVSPGPATKLKKPKPTHPKPFRLRTDERGILKEANLERRTDPVTPQSEPANLSTPSGKVQKKQGNDIQKRSIIEGMKISRGQKEGSKPAAASVTPSPQRNHSSKRVEPKPKSSPLKSNATQRLEKFRKIKSPLQKHSVRPQGLIPTKKETTTTYLIPGQKLDVIHETSPEVSELRRIGKLPGNATHTSDVAACDASRSSSRGRRPAATVAVEPNFHSIHVPRSCTKKLNR